LAESRQNRGVAAPRWHARPSAATAAQAFTAAQGDAFSAQWLLECCRTLLRKAAQAAKPSQQVIAGAMAGLASALSVCPVRAPAPTAAPGAAPDNQGRGPRHARRRAARRGAAGARPPWLPPRAAAARGVLTRAPGLAQEGQGRDAEDDAWRHFQDVLRSPERGRYSGVVGVLRMITRQVPGTHCRKARPGLPCRVCETVVRVSRGVVRRVLAAVMLPLNCAAHFCSMCIVAGCST